MENNIEFKEFKKIARLSREMVITEKIDGVNVQLLITEDGSIHTGSRNRLCTPEDDHFGFSQWVSENNEELLKLGVGRHFGEWWGSGIQRGYGLPDGDRRLSLFNTVRWVLFGQEPKELPSDNPNGVAKYQQVLPKCVGLVPELYRGLFDTNIIDSVLEVLCRKGSRVMPGFMNPEGVVVYHMASKQPFKKTLNNDGLPKSKVKHANK